MSKFPIESQDSEGIRDAVNYLLSGPGGLGQDVAGFKSFTNAYLTGNFRPPFTSDTVSNLYVSAINLSNAEQIDDRTIKYTFASTQLAPPFALGNGLRVTGVVPSTYNSQDLQDAGYPIGNIGVIECTTTYVIVRTRNVITTPLGTYVSGGSISYRSTENTDDSGYNSTDCNARVTVQGGTEQVLLSSQLTQTISYEVITGPVDLSVYVSLRRYAGFPNNDPVNPDFLFNAQGNVMRKIYTYPGLTGTGTLSELETIFSTVVDNPGPGYYWYILEVLFEYPLGGTEIQVTTDELGLRSLTAQVVKP